MFVYAYVIMALHTCIYHLRNLPHAHEPTLKSVHINEHTYTHIQCACIFHLCNLPHAHEPTLGSVHMNKHTYTHTVCMHISPTQPSTCTRTDSAVCAYEYTYTHTVCMHISPMQPSKRIRANSGVCWRHAIYVVICHSFTVQSIH